MKKILATLAFLVIAIPAIAGIVSKPFTFSNNTVADANEVNSDFDTLYALVNGNLDSTNLIAGAIGTSDLADDSVNFLKIDWGVGANQVRGTETTSWRLGQGGANYIDIASPALSGNRTWTLQDSNDTFVGRATTDTLTNKSLTSPTITGSPTAAGATWTNLGSVTTADINGGTIDGTIIGGSSASTGAFTTLTAATLDTGQGANELFDMDQNVLTISNVTFASITEGANAVPNSTDNLSFFASTTSAQLAGVISNETGSGLLVFGTAPTLSAPAIADFTSATHSHQNNAGGGTLNASAIAAGTLPVARGGTGVTTSTGGTNVVLSASPTLSGTIGGNLTWSGSQIVNNNLSLTTGNHISLDSPTNRTQIRDTSGTMEFTVDNGVGLSLAMSLTAGVPVHFGTPLDVPDEDPPQANTINANSGAKAWASLNFNGTILSSYNIVSVSHPATGRYVVNWDTDFASANYAAVGIQTAASAEYVVSTAKSASSCEFRVMNNSGGLVDDNFDIIAFGTQ